MNSRTIVIIGLSLLSTNMSFGQKKSNGQRDPNETIEEYNLRKYKNMKEGGVALIVLGGILVVTGGIIEATQFSKSMDNMFSTEPEKEYNNIGTVLFCSGAVMVGGGIPLTIVGHRKYKQYKNKPDVVSLGIKSNAGSTGLSLSYRF